MFFTIKNNITKFAQGSQWRWFLILYFGSLLAVGSVYGLKHLIVGLLQ